MFRRQMHYFLQNHDFLMEALYKNAKAVINLSKSLVND